MTRKRSGWIHPDPGKQQLLGCFGSCEQRLCDLDNGEDPRRDFCLIFSAGRIFIENWIFCSASNIPWAGKDLVCGTWQGAKNLNSWEELKLLNTFLSEFLSHQKKFTLLLSPLTWTSLPHLFCADRHLSQPWKQNWINAVFRTTAQLFQLMCHCRRCHFRCD